MSVSLAIDLHKRKVLSLHFHNYSKSNAAIQLQ